MEENKNDLEKQEGVLRTLVELIAVQSALNMVNAQMALRDRKYIIGNSIHEMEEDYLGEKEEKANIIEEYKNALEEIDDLYNDDLKDILEEKTQKEEIEYEFIAKENDNNVKIILLQKKEKELRDILAKSSKKEEFEAVEEKFNALKKIKEKVNELEEENKELDKKRSEIRKEIEKLANEYDKLSEEKSKVLSDAIVKRNNQMIVVNKQNIFKKFFGMLINKFRNNKDKMAKYAVDSIMNNIDHMKREVLPNRREKRALRKEKQKKFFKDIIKSAEIKKNNFVKKRQESIANKKKEVENKKQFLKDEDKKQFKESKNKDENQEIEEESLR